MALTNEHVGPMILAKIKIYVFTRAELLIHLCYKIPCITYQVCSSRNPRTNFEIGFGSPELHSQI